MVCAGYIHLQLPELGSTTEADEGTAAGEYLQKLLEKKPVGNMASNGHYFDDNMKFLLEPIRDDVESRAHTEVLCEQRIDWQTQSGIWIKGQYDIAFVDHQGTLCIEDLKYGWGIVEVERNWQLLGYAIGEVMRRGRAFDKISMTIHQPRPHHEDGPSRKWVISYKELLEYKEVIEKRMIEIANGRDDLQTSKNCKYCAGAAEACPAFNRLFYRAIEVTTEFFQDSITDQELANQLDIIKRAEEVLKIKKDSITELGIQRIKQGKLIPGYVQTQKFGNRAWKKGITPETIKVMTGIDPTERVFMSPAKAEKAGVPKDLVKSLAQKFSTGFKLEKKDTTAMGNKIFGTNDPTGGK